jgi:cytochrome oxidase Cu insertion factor (SCO1/SenC/PrrC family)/thiol-disulfide isomerase/thioredoxin
VADSALEHNPGLDPGTPLSRPAPDFTLTDEFGRRVSLRSFRGRAVLLAFIDSQCTTVCPLTTTEMLDAKALLGTAGAEVALLGVDANPVATAVRDVRAYSAVHGMIGRWHFLTAPLARLKAVWSAYGIGVQILRGQIDHTPALFAIDPQGRLRRVYLTQMVYASIGQQTQILARELASLLPGHPRVESGLSYAQIPPITPGMSVSLPSAGGGTVRLGPERSPRLLLFFATWDSETIKLAAWLEQLDRYQAVAAADRLPALTAVDEGAVEPSPSALRGFLRGLPRPLSFPVAIDRTGRVGDGYEVQDEPWLVLLSPAGLIMWYYDVSTQGPLTAEALLHHVRAALMKVGSPSAAPAGELARWPAPLAAIRAQAGQLLGGASALAARIRALRGYPIVLNVWASWCAACRTEASLFGSASSRYGGQVAFLGVDVEDSPGDARSFLAEHAVGYPSYQSTATQLATVAPVEGLPTTVFFNREGKVTHVQTGKYDRQGTLDEDIDAYALSR